MSTLRTWRRATPDPFWPQAADANIEHPPQANTNPPAQPQQQHPPPKHRDRFPPPLQVHQGG